MRGNTHVYSASNVLVALGSHMPSGFEKDSFISISELGDGVTEEAGADGEVVVSVSNDPRYEVKLKLQYGSFTCDWLLARYRANQQLPGSGFFPVLIKDLGDNPVFKATQAWVTKTPSVTYSSTGQPTEWTLHCIGELAPQ